MNFSSSSKTSRHFFNTFRSQTTTKKEKKRTDKLQLTKREKAKPNDLCSHTNKQLF
jgi:hypothetical protein